VPSLGPWDGRRGNDTQLFESALLVPIGGSITVNVEYHVAGVEADDGVRVGCTVIKCLQDGLHGLGGWG
jgi:hypothetical protein